MSRLYDLPEPSQIDYHSDLQAQRVEKSKKLIDVGDVIALVEDELAQVADPRQHALFELANFYLDRQSAVEVWQRVAGKWATSREERFFTGNLRKWPTGLPGETEKFWAVAPCNGSLASMTPILLHRGRVGQMDPIVRLHQAID
jgi:hypothetical protein